MNFNKLDNCANQPLCPVCNNQTEVLDCIDFNKGYPKSGLSIYYNHCGKCGFCFSPDMYTWTPEQFAKYVYNENYVNLDPDYVYDRPHGNADKIIERFQSCKKDIRHLDYGGGSGVLSNILNGNGFDSTTYDPFVNTETSIDSLGKFDLITAFEVFEHVTDVRNLMNILNILRKPDGLIYFSTLPSDGNISKDQRLSWWYASPSQGHISLFSQDSLVKLAYQNGLKLGSIGVGRWIMWDSIPEWAKGTIL